MKHRPYLTTSQLEFILNMIQDSDDTAAHEIRAALQPLLIKAQLNLVRGSYKPNPRPSINERLGLPEELSEEDEAELLKKIGGSESI